jgi:hypothetical protein
MPHGLREATATERKASNVKDGDGDLDCVLCATVNPFLRAEIAHIGHALSGNCRWRIAAR